jgi:hypothetical protein
VDLEQIKEANPIQDVVQEDFPLRGRGRFLRAQAHDSLVVDTQNGAYFWNSKGEQGDVIGWMMARKDMDFKGAVEFLAQRSGLPAPSWGRETVEAAAERRARYDALTVAARYWVRTLRNNKAALDYCYSRGWNDTAIKEAGLGYSDGDEKALRGEFAMHGIDPESPGAQAALKVRKGMLIYPHVRNGNATYISARSIDPTTPKKWSHYNPPIALIGDRQRYLNWEYHPRAEFVVVVEGQADAVSLGQWGIPAVALAGVAIDDDLLRLLQGHHQIYVAMDDDEAGRAAAYKLADATGPLTRVVTLPEHDWNDWHQAGATKKDAEDRLAAAPTWIELLAREAGAAGSNGNKVAAMRRVSEAAAQLDEFELAMYRRDLATAMDVGLREFDGMLRASESEMDGATDGDPLFERTIVGGVFQVEESEGYYLLETIYKPPAGAAGIESQAGGKTLFAVRNPDGDIRTVKYIDIGSTRYSPPPPNTALIRKRVISFAPDIGPLLTTGQLIERIQQTIHKYLDISEFFERMSAYYVLLTWFYDAFNIVPYLRFRGDYGTGKSRARKVVGGMCYRPMRASGAGSDAALFRMIDTWRGTLLMEEADYDQSDYAQLVVKMLNQGYDREQGIILRCADKSRDFETEAYICYGPKILAMRGEFSDKALESRCLTEEMRGKTRDDIPRELPREFWERELPQLQAMLLRYRLEHWRPQIEIDESDVDVAIEDRLIQITLSLFAILSLGGDSALRDRLQEYLAEYNRQMISQRGLSLAAKVLEALVIQWQVEKDENKPPLERDLSTQTIAELTNQLIDYENHGDEYIEKRSARGRDAVGVRKIGHIIRSDLQLNSDRSSKFGGRHVVEWDDRRIKSLRKRYGISEDRLRDLLMTYIEIQRLEQEAESVKPVELM